MFLPETEHQTRAPDAAHAGENTPHICDSRHNRIPQSISPQSISPQSMSPCQARHCSTAFSPIRNRTTASRFALTPNLASIRSLDQDCLCRRNNLPVSHLSSPKPGLFNLNNSVDRQDVTRQPLARPQDSHCSGNTPCSVIRSACHMPSSFQPWLKKLARPNPLLRPR